MGNPARTSTDLPRALGSWLADLSLIAAIVLAAVRCLISVRPDFVGGGDGGVDIAIGPVGRLVFDGLCALPLIGALLYRVLTKRTIAWLPSVLLAVSAAAALLIGAAGDGAQWFAEWSIVSHWPAAIMLGLAAMHTADTPGRRKLVVVSMVGLGFALSITAIEQFTAQHDQNVAYYEKNKAEVLTQQGWRPGSREMIKYETRLYQREAVGAFGLSNVFGSVLGALLCVGAGLAVGAWRSRSPTVAKIAMAVMALMVAAALGMTRSKGAVLALLMAGGAAGVAWLMSRGVLRKVVKPAVVYRVVAFGAVAAVVVIVIARLAAGPPDSVAGERSLLFRGYYLGAAMKMIADHPLTGVGDFQNAYLMYKNPLSPEDVSDPHHVFAMWIATAGVAGWLWSAIIVVWLWRAARGVTDTDGGQDGGQDGGHHAPGTLVWQVAVVAGAVFGFQWWVTFGAVSAGSPGDGGAVAVYVALMPALAAGVTVLVARFVDRRLADSADATRAMAVGLFIAAVAIVLHGQIEMNLTNAMSAPVLCVLLGVAGAAGAVPTIAPRRAAMSGAAAVIATFAAVVFGAWSVRASSELAGVAARHDQLARVPLAQLTPGRLDAMELSAHPHEQRLSFNRRVLLAKQAHGSGDVSTAVGLLETARARALRMADEFAEPVKGHRAAMYASAEMFHMTGDAKYRDAAIAHGRALLAAAPWSLDMHLFAADTAWALGAVDAAGRWYGRAGEIDALSYLDPNSRMTAEERQRARARGLKANVRRAE